jgi:hypothetical protein
VSPEVVSRKLSRMSQYVAELVPTGDCTHDAVRPPKVSRTPRFFNPAEALRYSGAKSKKELIHNALREYVEQRRRLNLLELQGRVRFSEGYDYKALRAEE